MGSNLDLRKHMDSEAVAKAFGKLISGKSNYKTIIEKRKEKIFCSNCRKELEGEEKFCPECGTKVIKPGQLIQGSEVQQNQQLVQPQQEQQTQNQQTQPQIIQQAQQPSQQQQISQNQTQNREENQQTQN